MRVTCLSSLPDLSGCPGLSTVAPCSFSLGASENADWGLSCNSVTNHRLQPLFDRGASGQPPLLIGTTAKRPQGTPAVTRHASCHCGQRAKAVRGEDRSRLSALRKRLMIPSVSKCFNSFWHRTKTELTNAPPLKKEPQLLTVFSCPVSRRLELQLQSSKEPKSL